MDGWILLNSMALLLCSVRFTPKALAVLVINNKMQPTYDLRSILKMGSAYNRPTDDYIIHQNVLWIF